MPQEICREARTRFQSPNNQNYNTTRTGKTKTIRKHPKWISVAFFLLALIQYYAYLKNPVEKVVLLWDGAHVANRYERANLSLNRWLKPCRWHTHHGCTRTHGKIVVCAPHGHRRMKVCLGTVEGFSSSPLRNGWAFPHLKRLSARTELAENTALTLTHVPGIGWVTWLVTGAVVVRNPNEYIFLGANDKVANSGALFCQWVENSLSKFMDMLKCINFELDTDLRRPGVNIMQTHKGLPPLVCPDC